MKLKTWVWIAGITIVLVALFAYPRLQNKNGGGIGSGVPCLVSNLPIVQHIHPIVAITVDRIVEAIPAGIGLAGCERAIHTHDDDAPQGVIHVESQNRRTYTLGDFMDVWGKSFTREGYELSVTANGASVADPASFMLEDAQNIKLDYKRITINE
ncbi:MAG: hypothetical protein HYU81_00380 [Candidatus Brennerbacteria bacterium]|nr:hypothetical protein [Candidatus Brennerbacteria bacterium]